MKYTKGPWEWWSKKTGRPPKYDITRLLGADGSDILSMYGGEGLDALGKSQKARANARLIEEAPNTIILLKKCFDYIDTHSNFDNKTAETLYAEINALFRRLGGT